MQILSAVQAYKVQSLQRGQHQSRHRQYGIPGADRRTVQERRRDVGYRRNQRRADERNGRRKTVPLHDGQLDHRRSGKRLPAGRQHYGAEQRQTQRCADISQAGVPVDKAYNIIRASRKPFESKRGGICRAEKSGAGQDPFRI